MRHDKLETNRRIEIECKKGQESDRIIKKNRTGKHRTGNREKNRNRKKGQGWNRIMEYGSRNSAKSRTGRHRRTGTGKSTPDVAPGCAKLTERKRHKATENKNCQN